MTTLDWIIFSAVWSLIPLCLILRARQKGKFLKWQKEDEENIRKYFEGRI